MIAIKPPETSCLSKPKKFFRAKVAAQKNFLLTLNHSNPKVKRGLPKKSPPHLRRRFVGDYFAAGALALTAFITSCVMSASGFEKWQTVFSIM